MAQVPLVKVLGSGKLAPVWRLNVTGKLGGKGVEVRIELMAARQGGRVVRRCWGARVKHFALKAVAVVFCWRRRREGGDVGERDRGEERVGDAWRRRRGRRRLAICIVVGA